MLGASPHWTTTATEHTTLHGNPSGVVTARRTTNTACNAVKERVSAAACNAFFVHTIQRGVSVVTRESARWYLEAHRFDGTGVSIKASMAVYLIWAFAATANGVGGVMTGCGPAVSDIKWRGDSGPGWLTPQLRAVACNILGYGLGSRVCAEAQAGGYVLVTQLAAPNATSKALWTRWVSETVAAVDPRAAVTSALGISPCPLPSMLTTDAIAQETDTGKYLGTEPMIAARSCAQSDMELLATTVSTEAGKEQVLRAAAFITSRTVGRTNAHAACKDGANWTDLVRGGSLRTKMRVNAPPSTARSWVGTTNDDLADGADVSLVLIDMTTSIADPDGLRIFYRAAVDAMGQLASGARRIVCVPDICNKREPKSLCPTSVPVFKRSRKSPDKEVTAHVSFAGDMSWVFLHLLLQDAAVVVLHGAIPLPGLALPEFVRKGAFHTLMGHQTANVEVDLSKLRDATDAALTGEDSQYLATVIARVDAGGPVLVTPNAPPDRLGPIVAEANRRADLKRKRDENEDP